MWDLSGMLTGFEWNYLGVKLPMQLRSRVSTKRLGCTKYIFSSPNLLQRLLSRPPDG